MTSVTGNIPERCGGEKRDNHNLKTDRRLKTLQVRLEQGREICGSSLDITERPPLYFRDGLPLEVVKKPGKVKSVHLTNP